MIISTAKQLAVKHIFEMFSVDGRDFKKTITEVNHVIE